MNQEPIFILGCHKSGTSLLRNLLDGHPELFVVPTETHFFANIGYQVRYSFRSQKAEVLSIKEMKTNLIQWIEKRNQTEDLIGDGFTKNLWNIAALKEHLDSISIRSVKELSDQFHSGLYKSLFSKRLPEEKRVVEKSVENSEFLPDWLALYPKAKFIHIVRNPYSNLVSLRKYVAKKTKHPKSLFWNRDPDHFPHLRNPVTSMIDSFYDLRRNERICKNYLVITYEDLVADTFGIMKSVAEFLKIDFDNLLLQPTILQNDWKGNSIRGKEFNGVSDINLDNWKGEISDFEIYIVNKLFGQILKQYNHPILKPKKETLWQRAPKESLMNYLLNRHLIFYSN